MRPRTLLLFALAALMGAAVAVLPALAAGPSEVKMLEVKENCVDPEWPCWTTQGSALYPEPASEAPIAIAVGGEIKFADNATTPATVQWTSSSVPMCSGIPASAATKWEGTCKFEEAGTYKFESPTMFDKPGLGVYTKYEIVVGGTGTGTTSTMPTTGTTQTTTSTPTTTPTMSTPTTTTYTPPPPTTTSTQPPSGGAAAGAVSSTTTTPGSEPPRPAGGSQPLATLALANAQHGNTVHGTVQIPTADGGARLEVELLAQSASLAKAKRTGSARVGRLVRSSAPAGKVSFAVPLDAQAKSALHHHHKLALTVKIVLTPKHGAAVTIARSVIVR